MKINTPRALRKFMKDNGLTQADVSRALGYAVMENHTCPTVYNMLRGNYNWEKNWYWVSEKLSKIPH